jgi:D-alanyl-D-alanine carboxypeptidase (penicillin-binding protein 5/6)
VLADATTGGVLAAKAPHLKHRPASTLKMLTAVTLLPRLTKSTVYMTVDGDVNVEGSRAGIVPNAPYTIDQLFYAMFLPSGNDAATALARAAGSVKSTVAMMNTQARYLQADDTTVVNPTGLDADGQYSSAYDLALIARAALQRPDFRKYIGTLHFQLPGKMPKKGHRRGTFQIGNQDKLLQEGYPGLIGGKTGYTTLAGRTFMAAAQRNGQTLIVTLMGITEPSADAAKSLLDWGFHNLAKTRPVGVLVGHVTPVTATTASPSASPESSSPSTGSPSTSAAAKRSSKGGGGHLGFLPWVGGALVLAGLMVAIRPLFRRRRKGTERDRLLAAVKRWNA